MKFSIVAEYHPVVQQYFDTLAKNLSEAVPGLYKGQCSLVKDGEQFVATIEFKKYIPSWFLWVAALPIVTGVFFYLWGSAPLGTFMFIPGLVFLFLYWFLQSTLFFYHLTRIGLKKAGYKGKVIYREVS